MAIVRVKMEVNTENWVSEENVSLDDYIKGLIEADGNLKIETIRSRETG